MPSTVGAAVSEGVGIAIGAGVVETLGVGDGVTPWPTPSPTLTPTPSPSVSATQLRLRDISDAVGISERRVRGIVTDPTASGYLTKERDGRRDRYAIHTQRPRGQDLGEDRRVGDLLALLHTPEGGADASP